MRLDVRPILYSPGKSLPFDFEMDLSDLTLNGRKSVTRPVRVRGDAVNRADMVQLTMHISTLLSAACDRCGREFDLPKETKYFCILTEELHNDEDDDLVLLEDGAVDLSELARAALILDMDTRTLCKEDCKGLCPRCGADLNLGPCSCRKEVDPRLAALAKLLE